MYKHSYTEVNGQTGVVRSWASIADEATTNQAEMTSRVPFIDYVALMPDAHLGVGSTIGSVFMARGAIIPAAVGVDLGCGMIALETDIERGAVSDVQERELLHQLSRTIPAGLNRGHDAPVNDWGRFATAHPLPQNVIANHWDTTAANQFASLGSGNHFVELAWSKDSARVWMVLHSGSRGVGNKLASLHIKVAQALCVGVTLEDRALAYLVEGTPEFDNYIADMMWAQVYAYEQRTAMMERLADQVERVLGPFQISRTINCHHNYACPQAGGWLTRKGAIDASLGVDGIIPGSMGAATYIVKGKGNEDALNSAPHGAGRLMSRGQARRTLTTEHFKDLMGGRTWQEGAAESLIDESPDAYKPIDVVMRDAESMVEIVDELAQFVNYKGVNARHPERHGARGESDAPL